MPFEFGQRGGSEDPGIVGMERELSVSRENEDPRQGMAVISAFPVICLYFMVAFSRVSVSLNHSPS
jgi:hypothetical protein